jgi:NAD(P)-dependent dehydrogenase (short-subunit alcohol dehydrogenase family)
MTGANSGIGLATTRKCVGLGAERVIIAVRTMSTGEEAEASIQESHPSRLPKSASGTWICSLLNQYSLLENEQPTYPDSTLQS